MLDTIATEDRELIEAFAYRTAQRASDELSTAVSNTVVGPDHSDEMAEALHDCANRYLIKFLGGTVAEADG